MKTKIKTMAAFLVLCMLSMFFVTSSAVAQEKPAQTEAEELAEVAAKTNNPVSDLWLLFFQEDFGVYGGDLIQGRRILNSFKFQPVIPTLISSKIRMITRPVFQFQSFEVPEVTANGLQWKTKHGMGDMVLLQAFAPADAGSMIFAIGPSWIIPTATDDALGGGKWAGGPAVVGIYNGAPWVVGAVVQHWWDFAGDDDRNPIKLTDIQYIIRYKINPYFQIGAAPNIQYNWETEELALPLGLGLDVTTKWGNTIFRYGFEIEHYVKQDDAFGPQWNFRFFFMPVIGNPF